MRDFLAYRSEESFTFAKKPLPLSPQGLSKLLGRTVSGVFKSLRPTHPIAEGEIVSYGQEEAPTKVSHSGKRLSSPQPVIHSSQSLLFPSSVEGCKSLRSPVSGSPPSSPPSERHDLLPPDVGSDSLPPYDLHLAITAEVQVSLFLY